MTRKPPEAPLVVVLGATGTGKSQLAVELATRFEGEIINGDAMQMYQGLPIITNKITPEEQRGIPHHLLGTIAIDEEPWTVGLFKKKATQIIQEIRSRGRLPILVGGTHYYTQSLLFDETLVETEAMERPRATSSDHESEQIYPILDGTTEEMLQRLQEVDPTMANRWHPKDRRKIRRSLEIYLTTGKRASDIYEEQQQRKTAKRVGSAAAEQDSASLPVPKQSVILFWVHSDPEVLKQRLDARIGNMVKMGLLDEVMSMSSFQEHEKMAGNVVDVTRGIWVSIGWKEFEKYLSALKSTECSSEDLNKLYELSIEQIQTATRQYAKRQIRWIRIKLMNALSEAGLREKLYVVDASSVAKWDANVSAPAIEITGKFLNADIMPLPQEVSPIARHLLTPDEGVNEVQEGIRQECQLCHVTIVNELQWRAHLGSRRHRALAKKRLKNSRSHLEVVPTAPQCVEGPVT
ncbi:P-loop containing nucleoside triphosphate hydrolase [Glarea lozoyensis ATCC 20868]|uniref:tRNA dimethylallyltransferase n=2 Tax=Glarea lozoyensis TaxID=101852 RepID=S3ED38_GLAL2|nr:P-loop containing nucleoside triphosphate hydrolase [Glarea lozoyensis ATCC 20868]EHK97096.1 putative tRNA dimethylallyltransferase, mitochondrial [Glarea lozoyensis 74030]EPE36208.1 P-loop containing nucleoside triphosphate hydrolase [Glarea lozoyensis ATCC 20868]